MQKIANHVSLLRTVLKMNLLVVLLIVPAIFAARSPSPLKKRLLHERSKHVSLSKKSLDAEYRLPTDVVPTHYKLDLQLEEDVFETNSFSGVVDIDISVITTTNSFKFHAKNIEIGLIELSSGNSTLDIASTETDSLTDTVTVNVETELTQGETYLLHLTYTGILSPTDLNGFYKSWYTEGDTVHYVASTDFEATNARKAFPCFDEPALKATFDISITFPAHLNAIANTNILNQEDVPG